MWGCEGGATLPLTIDGEQDFTCPRRPLLDDPAPYNELFSYANALQSGILPDDGGLQSQPHRLMQLVKLVGYFRSECAAER
jgi:hypothetical protein